MSGLRAGEAGPILAGVAITASLASIASAAISDVDLAAQADLINADSIFVGFNGQTLPTNLSILGAVVKTKSTGVVTVRLQAAGGAFAASATGFFVQVLAPTG